MQRLATTCNSYDVSFERLRRIYRSEVTTITLEAGVARPPMLKYNQCYGIAKQAQS
jgi:hypothetical protein